MATPRTVPAARLGILALLGDVERAEDSQPRYAPSALALDRITVLPQPRMTFERIEELAEDIARKGVLKPPIVARLTPAGFRRYLRVLGQVWDRRFRVEDFPPVRDRGRPVYLVLLAGERRIRACRHLWQHGCERCRARGPVKPGACFVRHFGGTQVPVSLATSIAPLPALYLQLSENTHEHVPEHEEARGYARLFRVLRRANPRYPITRFARSVGRSPETVGRALRFCELPKAIQLEVERRRVAYGIALELTRLQQAGLPSKDLVWWLQRFQVNPVKVEEYRVSVSRHLGHLRAGQTDLLAVMDQAQEEESRRVHQRRTVASNFPIALLHWNTYLATVLDLMDRGELGLSDSPFALGSPRKQLQQIIGLLERIDTHTTRLLTWAQSRRVRSILPELKRRLRLLDQALGDSTEHRS